MITAFIAGPFRADNPWLVEQNIRVAEQVGFQVAELGIMPMIPHTNTRFFDGTLTDEFWLDGTNELRKRCDILVMVDRDADRYSTGTQGEVNNARLDGQPVYRSVEDLRTAIDEGKIVV